MSSSVARGVKQVVTTVRQLEGAGFVVRRALGGAKLNYLDPFLMLDHFGPVVSKPGEAVLAPDHPHRGIETVTYMLQGEVEHHDSWGNSGIIKTGGIQWMSSGSGLVHSEMPSDRFQETGGAMEGFQLWINMAAKDKKKKPRYQDLTPEDSDKVTYRIKRKDAEGRNTDDTDVSVRVVAGSVGNVQSIIETNTPIFYLDATLHRPGAEFTHTIPREFNAFLYVYRGVGEFGSDKTKAEEGQLLVISDGDQFTIRNAGQKPSDELKVLLIGGKPIGEPIARYGPFVMNTQEEIRQAFIDYQNGKYGSIPGAEERRRKTQAALNKRGDGDEL